MEKMYTEKYEERAAMKERPNFDVESGKAFMAALSIW